MPRLACLSATILGPTILGLCLATPLAADEPREWAKKNLDDLVALYQHFHQTPELSFKEKETSARLAQELKAAGYVVTSNVGGYGVVGILKNGDGPRLMLRTDLDALPVTEQTGLVYASKLVAHDEAGHESGVMHACGHDIHITNLIAVARYLAANKDRWRGTIMCIGQPAEEKGGGAKAMLKDGLFTRFPKPDFALALHCSSALTSGTIGYRAGYTLANVDSVDITMHGKGGHGAYPHTTVDPIVQAAHLVLDLQTIVSRELKPTEPAVVTVGAIHGGTKHNIIGESCHLMLTVRNYNPEVRKQILAAIKRKANAVAASAGAKEPTITLSDGTPATYNDEKLVERIVPVFRRVLGDDRVIATEPTMGGEDFSEYGLAGVPIFMFWLGTIDQERMDGLKRVGQQPPSLHSPLYYPTADESLETGVTAMASAVLELLPAGK